MILSDKGINQALKKGLIKIEPFPGISQFTSSALDLRLGRQFFEWIPEKEIQVDDPPGLERPVIIDPSKITDPHLLFGRCLRQLPTQPDGSYTLGRHKFVLAATLETITLPSESKLAARVEGRSTLARCGLVVHLTAPVIHAGFTGIIVLELCNFGEHPIKLVPGHSYCQLVFEKVSGVPGIKPQTKYQSQKGVRTR